MPNSRKIVANDRLRKELGWWGTLMDKKPLAIDWNWRQRTHLTMGDMRAAAIHGPANLGRSTKVVASVNIWSQFCLMSLIYLEEEYGWKDEEDIIRVVHS